MFRQSYRTNVTSCILQGLCCDNRWPPVHLSSLHRPQPPPGPGHQGPSLYMCSSAPHVQFSRSNDPPPAHKESPELEVNTGALCLAWVLTRTKPPDSDHRWRHGSMSGHTVMDDLLPQPTQPGLLYRPHANTGNKLFRSGFSSLFIFLNDRELVTAALRILFIS